MANLLDEVDSENDAQLQARRPEGTAPVVLTHKIGWHVGAKYKFKYNAYLVQVSDITQTSVAFQFVSCKDGKLVGSSHRLDLGDFSKVYPFAPSTLPTRADLTAGNNVAILLLNSANLGDLKADADFAEPDDGKWPRVTSEDRLQDENTKLKGALRQLLQMPTTRGGISPKDWQDYAALIGA